MKATWLGQEGRIGQLSVKNRIVMPAMATGLASTKGEITDALIAYYEERARGGAGLIIVEIACVDPPQGRGVFTQIAIDGPEYVAGLGDLASAIKMHGARAFIQLHHAGRQTMPAVTGGLQPVAPSPIACRMMQVEPRELSLDEIELLKTKFLTSAFLANQAGFDGIEIHAAHGYLLSEFLSPYSNHRNDQYGGNTENRARLVCDIIRAIKGALPALAVSARFNVDDFVKGGITYEEGIEIARLLEKAGADLLDVSAGIYESGHISIEPAFFKEAWRMHLAEGVKKAVNIPVMGGGTIRHPEMAEQLLADGKADFIWVGRGMIADPYWAAKALNSQSHRIRPCISCNNCINNTMAGKHVTCTVNPFAAREIRLKPIERKGRNRKYSVLIAGAGPAGMQAALTLTRAGFKVKVLEKEHEPGGLLGIASKPLHKEKIAWLKDYFVKELGEHNVDIKLGKALTEEMVRGSRADAVILAVGAEPYVPPIPGIEQIQAVLMEEVLDGRFSIAGREIIVVGGGSSGCEVAELMASQGNAVTIIEQNMGLAEDMENMNRLGLIMRLKQAGIKRMPGYRLERVQAGQILARNLKEDREELLKADCLVWATGYQSRRQLVTSIKARFENVHVIGDAFQPASIQEAILQGEMAAQDIAALFRCLG